MHPFFSSTHHDSPGFKQAVKADDIAQYFAIIMVADLCYRDNNVSHLTIEQWDQSNNDVWIGCTIRPMLMVGKIPSHDELTKVKNGNSFSDINHVDVLRKVPRKVFSFA
jgi:hypothetical protein